MLNTKRVADELSAGAISSKLRIFSWNQQTQLANSGIVSRMERWRIGVTRAILLCLLLYFII